MNPCFFKEIFLFCKVNVMNGACWSNKLLIWLKDIKGHTDRNIISR